MHTNHRRRVKKDKYIKGCHYYGHSKKWYKQLMSGKRRANERELMENERYDELLDREHRNILWNWF